jgi:hypothetical protein
LIREIREERDRELMSRMWRDEPRAVIVVDASVVVDLLIREARKPPTSGRA